MNITMIIPAFDEGFPSLDFEENIEIEKIKHHLQYHFPFCANQRGVTNQMPIPVKDKFYNFEGIDLKVLLSFPTAPC